MAVQVGTPGSIWMQLANFSFMLSGLFGDLLVVRACLILAYSWVVINAATGWPLWPNVISEPIVLPLDTLVWCVINLYVHMSSITRLLLDERWISLSEHEELLWRMFYRRSGISRILFKRFLAPHMQVHKFTKGDLIPEGMMGELVIYIVLEGRVFAESRVDGKKLGFTLYSGEVFDIKYLNVIGLHVGFSKQRLRTRALTDVSLVAFPVSCLMETNSSSPLARAAWHSLVTAALSKAAERPWVSDFSDGSFRGNQLAESMQLRDRIFDPLEDFEKPEPAQPGSGLFYSQPCAALAATLRSGFSPPWPFSACVYGLRQGAMVPPANKEFIALALRSLYMTSDDAASLDAPSQGGTSDAGSGASDNSRGRGKQGDDAFSVV